MKKNHLFWLILLVTTLLITACKADTNVTSETGFASDNPPEEAAAYPLDERAYLIEEFQPLADEAYPITEDDLALLMKSWRLTTYAEDGVESDPPLQTLTFNDDGTYALATETELVRGSWTTILMAVDSILVLQTESGETLYHQILALEEDAFELRTQRENAQIDEGYLPEDTYCECH